jgi:hypothetical protein
VRIISFSDFIRMQNASVKLLKMDIEGSEVEILEEFLHSDLATRVQQAFVETHEMTHAGLRWRTYSLIRLANAKHPNWNFDWS